MLIAIPNFISTGVPANEQRIIYDGKQVNSSELTLSELNIKEGSLLHMSLRLPISNNMYEMFRPYFKKELVM